MRKSLTGLPNPRVFSLTVQEPAGDNAKVIPCHQRVDIIKDRLNLGLGQVHFGC